MFLDGYICTMSSWIEFIASKWVNIIFDEFFLLKVWTANCFESNNKRSYLLTIWFVLGSYLFRSPIMFKEVQGGCFIFFTESILSGICILGRYFFVTHKPITLYYKIIYIHTIFLFKKRIKFNYNCIKESLFLGIWI